MNDARWRLRAILREVLRSPIGGSFAAASTRSPSESGRRSADASCSQVLGTPSSTNISKTVRRSPFPNTRAQNQSPFAPEQ